MAFLKIKQSRCAAMTIRREALHEERLVYLALTNKPIKYKYGRSRIAYIGTTKRGVERIAQSAAKQSKALLGLHGVRELEFYVVACGPRQGLKTWKKLERALIILFREQLGEVPKGNKQGPGLRWKDEREIFGRRKLEQVLESV